MLYNKDNYICTKKASDYNKNNIFQIFKILSKKHYIIDNKNYIIYLLNI